MPETPADLAPHWDAAYDAGPGGTSWNEDEATVSLALIDRLAIGRLTPVVDVGGGASPLAANLLARGFADLTVLDVSQRALDLAREHLGARAADVTWIRADLREWEPRTRFGLWHDRAVLHFLTDPDDQARYTQLIARAVVPGGHAIIATFAPDGPERCSGLPVVRYSPADLRRLLGDHFDLLDHRKETHHTPRGTPQRFTWITAVRSLHH